jgi:hypothetical protein
MVRQQVFKISAVLVSILVFYACNQNQDDKAAERYRDMVKSSTGKTISVTEAKDMLKDLEDKKAVKSEEIGQALNLLKAKYDYKPFPPEELQGKMMYTFILRDYLMNDDRNILFVGQLDDVTNEEGQFVIHLSSPLQLSDWRGRKKARFHLRTALENIEPIINNPPAESEPSRGFRKQYFVICKVNELNKVQSYQQLNPDNERIGPEIVLDTPAEYQIDGELVEIIPYPQ